MAQQVTNHELHTSQSYHHFLNTPSLGYHKLWHGIGRILGATSQPVPSERRQKEKYERLSSNSMEKMFQIKATCILN